MSEQDLVWGPKKYKTIVWKELVSDTWILLKLKPEYAIDGEAWLEKWWNHWWFFESL